MALIIVVALAVTLALFWVLGLKYALGAIVALIHDLTIAVGALSLMDKEITLTVIAALLTIIGYSLNDTIIVYDRVRENLKKLHKTPLGVIINRSVNETLSRTILTAGTVFVVVMSLFFLGGDIIHDFAFALLVGVMSARIHRSTWPAPSCSPGRSAPKRRNDRCRSGIIPDDHYLPPWPPRGVFTCRRRITSSDGSVAPWTTSFPGFS